MRLTTLSNVGATLTLSPKLSHFDLSVVQCEGEKATIVGDQGIVIEVLKSDYQKYHNTLIYSLFKQIDFFMSPVISVHVEWAQPKSRKKVVRGKIELIPSLEVNARVKTQDVSQTIGVDLSIHRSKSGVDSIILLREFNEKNYFMKKKGVIDRVEF